MRRPGAEIEQPTAPPELDALRPRLAQLARDHPGVLIEDKGGAIAIHYRSAPEAGPEVEAAIRDIVGPVADRLTIQPGKMVFEIRPAGISKAVAVERLMAEPAFAGRRALAIGDDLTDEAMFAAVNQIGGVSIRVGADQAATAATYRLDGPAAVRQWIVSLAEAL
jgi:trehalose 6-phosphate phosphatase